MSLAVWLPLNGDLHNQGLKQYNLTMFRGTETYNNNGKIGKCFYSNGTNTIKIMNIIPDFYNYSGYSFCAWFYIEAQNTSHTGSAIISAGNWNDQVLNLSVGDWETDHYKYLYVSGTSWNNKYQYNFQKNTWYHVVVSSDGIRTRAYVNGILLGDTLAGFLPSSIEGNDICIGGATYYPGMQFYGRINDVRIYNHALSPKEVEEIAKGLVLHYKLDNNGMGGDNLALNTRKLDIASSKANLYMYRRGIPTIQLRNDGFSELKCTANWQGLSFWANQLNLSPGTKVTYSFYIYGNGSSRNLTFFPLMYNSAGTRDQSTGLPISIDGGAYTTANAKSFANTTATSPEYHYVTFEWNQAVANIITNGGSIELSIQVSGTWNSGDWACIFAPKLEIGDKPTPWSPAKSELGDMATTVYDCSGYSNNGTIIGNLGAAAPSPRYDVATVFDGSSSTIKVNDNNWCSQGMEQITINVWVKASSWPGNTRIFSCTEGGGFNTEGGDSGYYRFPVCVYTNANKTSQAYKYGGQEIKISDLSTTDWNMLTFVYDLTGTKTYINGELHYTYSNISYGICFNMDARLFLGCEAALASPSSPYFNGQESDFRIYATALSAQQIKELYTTSMQIDSSGNVFARKLVEL